MVDPHPVASSVVEDTATASAVTQPIEIAPDVRNIMANLEEELLLQLWLHLERQRDWLRELVEEAGSVDEAEASFVLLGEIGQQADMTWEAYLRRESRK